MTNLLSQIAATLSPKCAVNHKEFIKARDVTKSRFSAEKKKHFYDQEQRVL